MSEKTSSMAAYPFSGLLQVEEASAHNEPDEQSIYGHTKPGKAHQSPFRDQTDDGELLDMKTALRDPLAGLLKPARTAKADRSWREDSTYEFPIDPESTDRESREPTVNRPPTPDELEATRPIPPIQNEVNVTQSWRSPSINKWRVLSTCIFAIGNGMNDSAPGALLPYMEKYYHIGYAIVSLIFIGNAIGFILAAFFVHALDHKLGRARTLVLTDVANVGAFLLLGFAPPFPAFVVGYFLTGLSQAVNLSLNNVWVSNLANGTVILGWFHGAYGIGGLIAPIIATTMVNRGVFFARFYFILLGLRATSAVFAGWAFWNFEKDVATSTAIDLTTLTTTYHQHNPSDLTAQAADDGREVQPSPSKLGQLVQSLRNRITLVGALFIFAYQGAEVSISGWVISFLINYRNGSPAQVGYVTAGFWGGIAIGRLLLSYAAHRIGEKVFTYGLIVGSIGFQLLVWFVPNVIGDAVGIAILGLLLGPVWPCAAAIFARLLPRELQNTALAFVSGAGSSGGAIAPFLTGLLAQVSGTWVLHPICIALFVMMIACWAGLPKVDKRRD